MKRKPKPEPRRRVWDAPITTKRDAERVARYNRREWPDYDFVVEPDLRWRVIGILKPKSRRTQT